MGLGHKGRGVDHQPAAKTLACLQSQVDQRLHIGLGLARMADHEIELELRKILRFGQVDGIQESAARSGFC